VQEGPVPRADGSGPSALVPLWLAPLLAFVAFTVVALVGAVALLFTSRPGLWESAAATVVFATGLGGALIFCRRLSFITVLIARAEVQTFELESAAELVKTEPTGRGEEGLAGLREDIDEAVAVVRQLIALGAGTTAVPLRAAIMRVQSLLDSKPDSPAVSGDRP
jgi:hypothetical protein